MRQKKIKIQKTLDSNQIAAFLRLLASEIEGSSGEGLKDYGVDLHNFNKLKVGLVKQEGGQLDLKLKIKDEKPHKSEDRQESSFEDISEIKYKPLKKQMAKTFKEIGRAVKSKTFPADELIETFMKEAGQMVSFPGFGDEYYAQFMEECSALKEAHFRKDSDGFAELYGKLQLMRAACHRRYK